jgi:Undecaprenyl-phosphate galactose phosphotransferase WbaP
MSRMLDIEDRSASRMRLRQPGPMARRFAIGCQIIADLVALELSVALGLGLRAALASWFPIGIGPSVFAPVHALVLLLPAAYAAAGLYPGFGMTPVERLRKRVMITSLCFACMILFDYLALGGQWSRGVLLAALASALFLGPIGQALAYRLLVRNGCWGMPVVVFGAEPQAGMLAEGLRDNHALGLVPVSIRPWPALDEAPLPGVDLAILVLAGESSALASLTDRLAYPRVMIVPRLEETQRLWVTARDLGGQLGLEMRRNLHDRGNRIVKRTMDIAIAAAVLIPGMLLVGLFALLVKLASPGPAFFAQTRLGRGARPFRLWKIRSMHVDAEQRMRRLLAESPALRREWEQHMKLRRDPRLIPHLGRFMRRWSLDELPQLWHVLVGDMSLVGPRPLPAYHNETLSGAIRNLRESASPGITGLVQVSGRSDMPVTDQEAMDVYYVRNWSLWLDLHILGLTVGQVISGRGAR